MKLYVPVICAFTVIAAGISVVPAAATATDMDKIYETELMELQMERDRMQKELERIRKNSRRDSARRRAKILTLTDRLMYLRLQSDKSRTNVSRLDNTSESGLTKHDLLDSTVEQAAATLEKGGFPADDINAPPEAVIPELFSKAVELIKDNARIRKVKGAYYDSKGREVEGTILKIGRMAAMVDGPESGPLAPVGKNSYRILDPAAGEVVASVVKSGEFPPFMPVFLIDHLATASGKEEDKSFVEHIKSGGIIVWPIIGLGFLALLIFLEKLVALIHLGANSGRLTENVMAAARAGDFDRAREECHKRNNCDSRVMMVGLKNRGQCRENYETLVNEAILAEQPRLERFLQILNVIAAVAPLMGLLGTVTGMISTFDVITTHGTGNPKLLSGGISEALVTTEVGLMVAIPTLLLHAFLARWIDRISSTMERAALKVAAVVFCRAAAGVADTASCVSGKKTEGTFRHYTDTDARPEGSARTT